MLLVLVGTAGAVQEEKEWKPDIPSEDGEFPPEEAMKLLKDAQNLMGRSAELLQDSSRGKALKADRELLEKIEKLLKKEKPESFQGQVLKLVEKLLKKAEQKQQNSLDKIKEIIRRVRT